MMAVFLTYLKVFLTGGTVCLIAQFLINKTKITSTRILVMFLLIGVFLEVIGIFDYIKEWGSSGITTPIIGFGASLAKGAVEGVRENGILGALTGGHEKVLAGLSSVIFFSFLAGLFCKSRAK